MTRTRLGPRFDEALAMASALHRDQRRKGVDSPYIGHLLAVAAIVLDHGGSEDQAIGALLHDAIEDQAHANGGAAALAGEIRRRFGDEVLAIVEACTDAWVKPKPEWRARKEQYIAHIGTMHPSAVLVSLADKLQNAQCINRDMVRHGMAVFDRFVAGREGTLWYYKALADAFQSNHPSSLAAELFQEAVKMRTLADLLEDRRTAR